MKILMTEKLGPHKYKDNHGYLICTDCIMARTGKQTYTRNDCFGDGDQTEIEVDRKAEDVFDPKTLASFENVPITIEHPDNNVDPDNYNALSVGYMRDIHKGTYEGQPVMMGTAVLTDSEGIEKVESGELTNLSCGYDCDVDDSDHPHQSNIRGNHIALCEIPRAGITHIQDSYKRRKIMKKDGYSENLEKKFQHVIDVLTSRQIPFNKEGYEIKILAPNKETINAVRDIFVDTFGITGYSLDYESRGRFKIATFEVLEDVDTKEDSSDVDWVLTDNDLKIEKIFSSLEEARNRGYKYFVYPIKKGTYEVGEKLARKDVLKFENQEIEKKFAEVGSKLFPEEDSENDIFTCVLCGKKSKGHGNNPYPLADHGKACDKCNIEKVTPVRLKSFNKKNDAYGDIDAVRNLIQERVKGNHIDPDAKKISQFGGFVFLSMSISENGDEGVVRYKGKKYNFRIKNGEVEVAEDDGSLKYPFEDSNVKTSKERISKKEIREHKHYDSSGLLPVDDWFPEDHYDEMDMMNLIIQSLNDEDAYYQSWINLWPDESEAKDGYFDEQEDYNDLKNLFIYLYKKHHKDGIYTPSIEIEKACHDWDKKLGLKPIENLWHKIHKEDSEDNDYKLPIAIGFKTEWLNPSTGDIITIEKVDYKKYKLTSEKTDVPSYLKADKLQKWMKENSLIRTHDSGDEEYIVEAESYEDALNQIKKIRGNR